MELIVAKHAGFCFGVRRIVNILMRFIERKKKVAVYGDLIHNQPYIDELKRQGVKFIYDISDIKKHFSEYIILTQAHGITQAEEDILKSSNVIFINGVCPRVQESEKIAIRCVKQNKDVFIIGDKEHKEVKSILSRLEGRGHVISSSNYLKELRAYNAGCIIFQTTQKTGIYFDILRHFSNFEVYNTICEATQERQEDILKLSKLVNAIVIIGGYTSANTKRLKELSEEKGLYTQHIERVSELDKKFFTFNKVGLHAGASTPESDIKAVIEIFKNKGFNIKELI